MSDEMAYRVYTGVIWFINRLLSVEGGLQLFLKIKKRKG
jgi:hypothetical protein